MAEAAEGRAMFWQPIATAPRNNDGVAFLVGRFTGSDDDPFDGEQSVVQWWVANWATSVCIPSEARTVPVRLMLIPFEPTHWTPLPAPPDV